MLLNQNNFGATFLAIPKMMEVFRAQLSVAKGVLGLLNVSSKIGVDALLTDAIEGRMQESSMPCVRITWSAGRALMPTAGGVLNTALPIHLFFFYATGAKGSALPSEFSSLREQHIAWNLEYLKDQLVGPNQAIGFTAAQHADDSGSKFWWYADEQEALINHETPFDLFGLNISVPVSSGLACSRVDFEVTVKNHCTFKAV